MRFGSRLRLALLVGSLGGGACRANGAASPELRAVNREVASSGAGEGPDLDGDGLADALESALAERFAPVVVHSSAESNLPIDVDSFLQETSLWIHDDACSSHDALVVRAPDEGALLGHIGRPCGTGRPISSDGTRSLRKRRTFYLEDVAPPQRAGGVDARRWRTYVHAYPNDVGGVTIQYWRFYAFNDAVADHGGDWEGLHVVLGRDGAVARVRLLGHRSIADVSPRELRWEGDHPVIYSEIGGHTSRAAGDDIPARGCAEVAVCAVTLDDFHTRVRQETWTAGSVEWPDGHVTGGGGLVNMGEKSAPLNGQAFVRYSGLWGSPGCFYATSGYWGPAFNETSLRDDGYVTAWCAGLAGALDPRRECYAADPAP